jgi:quinol monooxygenase YgiN
MVTVGYLIRYEAKPGREADVERALKEALSAIQQEPATTAWFAIRLGPSTFGVFDAFPDEEGRQAHFKARAAQLQQRAAEQFVEGSLVMQEVDILAAKLPAPGATGTVTVGFLSRFEAKPGKGADVERALNGTLLAVQQLPATTAWFALRLGPTTFGTVDLFPDEAGRQAHYNARWPQLQERASQLFVEGSLLIEKVDIFAAKLPG